MDQAEIYKKKAVHAKTRELHQCKAREAEIEEKLLQSQLDIVLHEQQLTQVKETTEKVESELKTLTEKG